ncbi:MAG: gliding motility-associated C-terminal domain-containing protein [Flavobacteriales bacterium]|nr:MAG: gliding motility-associated C-terminal domain-containing protein [Flavobacteriales bacterium]
MLGRPLALLSFALIGAQARLGAQCAIALGNDVTICQGQTATLNGPPGFPNYNWSNGATTQNITVGAAGNYTCTVSYPTGNLVTNGNFSGGNTGFTSQFNYAFNLQPEPTYNVGLNANWYHPQWQGTGTGNFLLVNAGWMHAGWSAWCQTINVCPNQTYTLTLSAMNVATQGAPLLDWSVDGVQINQGMQTGAQGAWSTFNRTWTSGPGQYSATFCIVVASGWGIGNDFGVDNISISSNITLSDQQQVFVTPLPVVNLGPDQLLCTGQQAVLNATAPGATYLWQDGSTAPTFTVTGAGIYDVDVTVNGCTGTDAVQFWYNPYPALDLGNDTTMCVGQNLPLNVFVPGATYQWQNNSPAPSYTVTGPGTYEVDVTLNGCTAQDTIVVNYNPLPAVALGNDTTLCDGEVLILDATTPNAQYLWQDGSTNGTLQVTAAGAYDVEVTVNGCSGTDAVNVNFNPLPQFYLGNDTTVCPGEVVSWDATVPGATYLWNDGSTASTLTTSATGVSSVTVTLNGCEASDAATLGNFTLQTVNLGPDVVACAGASVPLSVTVPGATYAWNNGSTSNAITVVAAGTYWVEATLNGCPVRDSVNVTFTPLPLVDLGQDTTLCDGGILLLDATLANATYLWNDGSSSATLNAGAGTWSVEVTANGCTNSDTIGIGWFVPPFIELGPDTTLCPGQTIVLDASYPGATHQWQDGSANNTLTASTAGNYNVQVTDIYGCSYSDDIDVAYASPQAIDLGNDTTLCAGATLSLDAGVPGATYAWSTGATTSGIVVSSAGNYSVTVAQGNCTVSDGIQVSFVANPSVQLPNDTTLCAGETLLLDATTAGVTYTWQNGSTAATYLVNSAGTYSVTVTNAAGCTDNDAITVSYATPGSIALGNDTSFCAGGSVLLDATLPGSTYLWSTGATSATITANTMGTYWVQATQGNCAVGDTINITVNANPSVQLPSDTTLCAGETLLLDATTPGVTYAWQNGSTAATFLVNSAGTYSITVTNAAGCTDNDAITVSYATPGSIDLGNDTSFCAGGSALLDATLPGSTYLWSTGATSATITANTMGTYWVQATQGNCAVGDTINITVNANPSVQLPNDTTLCAGETLLLDATTPGVTYAWQNGSTAATFLVNSAGTYSVTVTNAAGCTDNDAITVSYATPGSIDLGNDTSFCAGGSVLLDATLPGSTYLWSTGATSATITANTTGTYWVQATQGNCAVGDTINITVNANPSVQLPNDTTLCAGETLLLDATTPGVTYAWQNGSTAATNLVNSTGAYSVTVTNAAGCTDSDAITVSYATPGSIDLGNDTSFCAGSSVVLDATLPGSTYLWSTGATSATITANTMGTYWVQATQGNCAVGDTINITVNANPSVQLPSDTTLCAGETLLLDATTPGSSYEWQDGSTGPTFAAANTGAYSVTVTDNNGCVASDAMNLSFVNPAAVYLGADTSLCPGGSLALDAGMPGAQYGWSTGSTNSSITVASSGTYWVQAGMPGCMTSDTIVVSFVNMPLPGLGPDETLCEGDTLLLSVQPGGASVLWSDGSSGSSLAVSNSGEVSVVLSLDGCTSSDAVDIAFAAVVDSIDLGPDVVHCPGEPLQLVAPIAGAQYNWSTGGTSNSIVITEPGWYWLHVSGACTNAVDSILITSGNCGLYVYVPNTFTPDGDGFNDAFQAVVNGDILNYALTVFNRWGEPVWRGNDPSLTWDGTAMGIAAPDGVYVWTIEYKADTPEGIKQERLIGHVTLLR